ncbi:hypothetical protein FHX82_000071 [Amycolatopsis bartoniae]|uniref:hypothetical protein n=1 Tax=Amycolatopsis bartoniae TaxID=941986 RepID=UPI001838FF88|nr:hypothetical protein [Amycolatopsis bartoniae]MBB2933051.1 hypothetical protein [Amycolatopsis bartoniae]
MTLFPAGVTASLPLLTDGTVTAEQPTASGGVVVVLSTPDEGSAVPFEARLPAIAAALSKLAG